MGKIKLKFVKSAGFGGKIENEKNGCRQGSINVRNEKQNKVDGIILIIHPIKGKWSNAAYLPMRRCKASLPSSVMRVPLRPSCLLI